MKNPQTISKMAKGRYDPLFARFLLSQTRFQAYGAWIRINEFLRRLIIMHVNSDRDMAACLYPIHSYQMDEEVNFGFPSKPYSDFVSFYHQIRIGRNNRSLTIYPTGTTTVVCRLNNHEPDSFLVGTPTFAREAEYAVSGGDYFAAFLWPAIGYCLFPNPPNEIINRHIPIDEIFSGAARRLAERMALAKTFQQRIYLFERFLSEILIDSRQIPLQHKRLIQSICQVSATPLDHGAAKIRHAEFTNRHIRRLSIKYLGISPNLLSRIVRYQKSLHFLKAYPEDCMAGLAIEQGYFDQSHFIKEFKRFQGVTPRELIRRFSRQ